jgi:hypothetical protein
MCHLSQYINITTMSSDEKCGRHKSECSDAESVLDDLISCGYLLVISSVISLVVK